MNYIQIFKDERLVEERETSKKANRLIEAFTRDYPIERIENLTMDQYMFIPARDGAKVYSFCNRIHGEMELVCHSGNVRPNIYGIYRAGQTIKVSPTFADCDDYEVVFKVVKQEILFLLRGVAKGNYEVVKKCKLNSSFKYKLLAIYFPDLIIPVQTKWLLDEYCQRVGVMIYPKDEMIYNNIALGKWKAKNSEVADWDNGTFMRFCDWLYRSNFRLGA